MAIGGTRARQVKVATDSNNANGHDRRERMLYTSVHVVVSFALYLCVRKMDNKHKTAKYKIRCFENIHVQARVRYFMNHSDGFTMIRDRNPSCQCVVQRNLLPYVHGQGSGNIDKSKTLRFHGFFISLRNP